MFKINLAVVKFRGRWPSAKSRSIYAMPKSCYCGVRLLCAIDFHNGQLVCLIPLL